MHCIIDCVVYELLSNTLFSMVRLINNSIQISVITCCNFAMFLAKMTPEALRRPDCDDDLRVMYSRTVEDGCTVDVMVRAMIITAE